jgi:hypothetical protein
MNEDAVRLILTLAVGFGGVIVTLGFVFLLRKAKTRDDANRGEELSALADSLGSGFAAEAAGVIGKYALLPLFRRKGHARKVKNLITPEGSDPPAAMFDYEYVIGGPLERKIHHTCTVCAIDVPQHYPALLICPEGLVEKLLGGKGVDFSGNQKAREFSGKFRVDSKHEEFARELLDDDMMTLLLRGKNITVEIGGGALVFHRDKRLMPEEFTGLHEFAREFVGAIPQRVKDRYGNAQSS